jgi:hypothetical protein
MKSCVVSIRFPCPRTRPTGSGTAGIACLRECGNHVEYGISLLQDVEQRPSWRKRHERRQQLDDRDIRRV